LQQLYFHFGSVWFNRREGRDFNGEERKEGEVREIF
jgi:hypothetical protein